jgi:hypothetical protein
MTRFEFFIYGCEDHIKQFKEALKDRIEILDSGALKGEDINFGKDCAFENSGEGFSDSFVLVGIEVKA